MRLSSRQLLTIVLLCVCLLGTIMLCAFAPIRVALIALIATLAVCTLAILVFLRKVLSAVYQLRDARHGDSAQANAESTSMLHEELSVVTSRLDQMDRHLPERLAARVAFELTHQDEKSENAAISGTPQ